MSYNARQVTNTQEAREVVNMISGHGDDAALEYWARQGILCLGKKQRNKDSRRAAWMKMAESKPTEYRPIMNAAGKPSYEKIVPNKEMEAYRDVVKALAAHNKLHPDSPISMVHQYEIGRKIVKRLAPYANLKANLDAGRNVVGTWYTYPYEMIDGKRKKNKAKAEDRGLIKWVTPKAPKAKSYKAAERANYLEGSKLSYTQGKTRDYITFDGKKISRERMRELLKKE